MCNLTKGVTALIIYKYSDCEAFLWFSVKTTGVATQLSDRALKTFTGERVRMEKGDRELLLQISSDNPRLRKLYQEHIELERKLAEFERSRAYSFSASLTAKEIKKQKLKGMDEIMSILMEYKEPDRRMAS